MNKDFEPIKIGFIFGGIAQLGEHLPCKQGVMSSILIISTMELWFQNLLVDMTNVSGIIITPQRKRNGYEH